MTTFYLIEKGSKIGKITVEGSEVKLYPIKRTLKPWVRKLLAVLKAVAIVSAVVVIGLLIAWFIRTESVRWSNWYHECDQALGYQADYYSCRQYHIHK